MEWSGQQSQVPQHASQPVAGPVPVQQYPGVNPLQAQAVPAASPAPFAGAAPLAGGQPGQPVAYSAGSIPGAAPAMSAGVPPVAQPTVSVRLDDDTTDVNDAEWVNRAKRAIAGTHGDPHRQVQLIQHLRSQYLKQRFGRTVHTDKA